MSIRNESLKKIKHNLSFAVNKTIDNISVLISMIAEENLQILKNLQLNKELINNLYTQLFEDITWNLARSVTLLQSFRSYVGSLLIINEVNRINELIVKIGITFKHSYYHRYFKFVLRMLKINLQQLKETEDLITEFSANKAKIIIKRDQEINDNFASAEHNIVRRLASLVTADQTNLKNILSSKFDLFAGKTNGLDEINYNRLIKSFTTVLQALKSAEQIGDRIKKINHQLFYIETNQTPR